MPNRIYNDSNNLVDVILPTGGVLQDLCYIASDGSGLFKKRTNYSQPINGVIVQIYGNRCTMMVGNGITQRHGGAAISVAGQKVAEHNTDPSIFIEQLNPNAKSNGKVIGTVLGIQRTNGQAIHLIQYTCFDTANGVQSLIQGANNGLDKDGANIVLGQDIGEAGDPAKLLSNREIPMDGKHLKFKQSTGNGEVSTWIYSNGDIEVGGSVEYLNMNGGTNGATNNIGSNKNMNGKSNIDNSGIKTTEYVVTDGYAGLPLDGKYEYIFPRNNAGTETRNELERGMVYRRDGAGDITQSQNILGNSNDGVYTLGSNLGGPFINGSGGTPPTSTDSDVETLGIKGSNGQIVKQPKIYPIFIGEWYKDFGTITPAGNTNHTNQRNTTYTNTNGSDKKVRIKLNVQMFHEHMLGTTQRQWNSGFGCTLNSSVANFAGRTTNRIDEYQAGLLNNVTAGNEFPHNMIKNIDFELILSAGATVTFSLDFSYSWNNMATGANKIFAYINSGYIEIEAL